MANNRSPLVNGEYYHIYNRGVARQSTFLSSSDYQQALLALEYYEFERPRLKLSDFKKLSSERREDFLASLNEKKENLVQVVSFAFMPNHFHLLLQQVKDGGISAFVSKFTNSYTKYCIPTSYVGK